MVKPGGKVVILSPGFPDQSQHKDCVGNERQPTERAPELCLQRYPPEEGDVVKSTWNVEGEFFNLEYHVFRAETIEKCLAEN